MNDHREHVTIEVENGPAGWVTIGSVADVEPHTLELSPGRTPPTRVRFSWC